MKRICKNCKLYNDIDKVCSVVLIMHDEKYELPVLPNDSCHWERADKEIQASLEDAIHTSPSRFFQSKLLPEQNIPIEIKQVRAWSDGKNGYIEYPQEYEAK